MKRTILAAILATTATTATAEDAAEPFTGFPFQCSITSMGEENKPTNDVNKFGTPYARFPSPTDFIFSYNGTHQTKGLFLEYEEIEGGEIFTYDVIDGNAFSAIHVLYEEGNPDPVTVAIDNESGDLFIELGACGPVPEEPTLKEKLAERLN